MCFVLGLFIKMIRPFCVSLFQTVNTVHQMVQIVQEEEKKAYVFDFIHRMEPQDKVLIFVGKKIK